MNILSSNMLSFQLVSCFSFSRAGKIIPYSCNARRFTRRMGSYSKSKDSSLCWASSRSISFANKLAAKHIYCSKEVIAPLNVEHRFWGLDI